MNKSDFPISPEIIDAFHKSFSMFQQFAKQHGVTMMGTVCMLKRMEGQISSKEFGATQVKTFIFNHPDQDKK